MSGLRNGGKDGALCTPPSKRIHINESPSSKAMVSSGFGNSVTAMMGRIPYPMLTRTNYMAWAMRMKYFL
ncbi:hypothetical protein GUJ93_ZPchr0002g23652 [Zizania palustris]|uniref:DUF4219 domain-containing protein n=1 Tax=Zizania palustris TaxID=103762 RepID=A0A8J5SP22_ZIZPA|nr:hypothetical protein GUJ93_ZPchr0002g23652 [Zizania palustris]